MDVQASHVATSGRDVGWHVSCVEASGRAHVVVWGVAGCPRDWIGRYVDAHDWLVGARERPGVYFVRALWAHVGVHV